MMRLRQHFNNEPFEILAINVEEGMDKVWRFVNNRNLPFMVLLDTEGRVSKEYGVVVHPMKVLIDKKGNIVGAAFGYREWDSQEMKTAVRLLLDEL